MQTDLNALLALARDAAREAGALILEARSTLRVDHKGAIDLVTNADRDAEALILDRLQAAYPDHAINAEESIGIQQGHTDDNRFEWLVDPIDGTTNYAYGLPVFSVSIALRRGPDLLVGVVYDPVHDECFYAAQGGPAYLNGRALQVSQTTQLSRAFLATGFPYDARTNPDNNVAQFGHFTRRALAVRRLGSAALDLAYVAAGRYDGYWEKSLKPWDMAAGMLLVQAAGGRLSAYDGGPASPYLPELVASNGLIHNEMLVVLRDGEQAPLPADP